MSEEFRFWVGIDWATEAHQICVLDGQRKVVSECSVKHTGEAISLFAEQLVLLADDEPAKVAVSIETPHGAIIDKLMERGMAVFSINPKQLDRFRDRHTVAGAKDDRRDAFVLADSLYTDTPLFRRLLLADAEVVILREMVRMHEDLGQEVIALGNRLREQLHRFYQQVLQLGSVYRDAWLWELLELAPTPVKAQELEAAKVCDILKQYRIRRLDAKTVIETLCTVPLPVTPGVVKACERQLTLLLPRLRLAYNQQQQNKKDMEALLNELSEPVLIDGKAQHSDIAILRSLPGVGTIVAATIVAEAIELLAKRDYGRLRLQCGVGPVTKQSGKKKVVVQRTACNRRLRVAMYHWARTCVQNDPRRKEQYVRLRTAGRRHGRALRGVGDRLLAVLVAMLRNRELYDPGRWRGAETVPKDI
ncbi:MAG: IS110 family transposase [Deltaproteobacteria bacterium]|nr:IS110 family transposase [Deltaproteobacteria bacterium]